MPDQPIRISRSSGASWPYRFGPTPPGSPGNVSPDSIAQGVENALGQIGPGTNSASVVPTKLNTLSDVSITNVQDGDVLRYANNRWRNYNETELTDGGNF